MRFDLATETKFNQSVSSFKFGSSWKLTKADRHFLTDKELIPFINHNSVILDVGASTGITSYDLMEKLNFKFKKYYVTDNNLTVSCTKLNNRTYFFDKHMECILITSPTLVMYPKESTLAQRTYLKVRSQLDLDNMKKIDLVIPKLLRYINQSTNVELRHYDVLSTWDYKKPDIIKAANIFNRTYFSDQQLIESLRNLFLALNENGLISLTDNRDIEKVSLFQKSAGRLNLIRQINGGSEIQGLIINTFASAC